MRVILASGRGLLSGWLIAATISLLIDPHTIVAWSAAVIHIHHDEMPWWLAVYSLVDGR